MKLISSEYCPVSELTTEYWSHDGGRKVTVRVTQDVEPILKDNVKVLNSKSSKVGVGIASGLGVKVASIPMGLAEKMYGEGTNLMTCSVKELKGILNDSDFRKLRTAHGHL